MHEKRAKDKEKRLLEQEKQLYEARLRSQIRAKLVGKPDPGSDTGHSPMNPDEHVRSLADRFMKQGAEDLWNEKDGPIAERSPHPAGPDRRTSMAAQTVDLRKLIPKDRNFLAGNDRNLSNLGGNYFSSRSYSVQSRGRFRKNDDSSDDSDFDSDNESIQPFWDKNPNETSNSERDVRKLGSSASLGKYDRKVIKRRVPLNALEDECDFAQQVESIRYELSKKKEEREENEEEEASILSDKRYAKSSVL